MNILVILGLAIIWAGSSYAFRRLRIQRVRHGHHTDSMALLEYAQITIGSGIFTAWLIRIVFVPYERWGIGDLATLLVLAAGLCLLVIPRRAKTGNPNLLEMLPNQYGVFHLQVGEGEPTGLNWVEHTLSELDLRKKNLLVLAIIRNNEMVPFPKGPEMLRRHDDLLIFGALSELNR